jgi:hypothetical protein
MAAVGIAKFVGTLKIRLKTNTVNPATVPAIAETDS